MRYPLTLSIPVAQFLARKKLRREKKHALMISLDPLGACLSRPQSCAATANPNSKAFSVEECLAAVEGCGAPVVSICGGEPLEYPEIGRLVKEILDRGHNLFLCTDGTLIRRKLHTIQPDSRFFWNIYLHGTEMVHDRRVGRPGTFREAIAGIKSAKNAGFFVCVNTTIDPDTDVQDVAALFALLHEIHVDGYMLSPVFSDGAMRGNNPAFRAAMQERFREAAALLDSYNLMIFPLYFHHLRGERALDGTSWGGLAGGCEMSALLNPEPGDTWKLLKWLFSRSMGEKRASLSPAGAHIARDLNKGARLAPTSAEKPMEPDSEDEPEMVSGGGQGR
jgi:hopanoid biosynthesis associated radical SAM protein HpnH